MRYTDFINEEKKYVVYLDGVPKIHATSKDEAEEYAMIMDVPGSTRKVEIRYEELPKKTGRDLIGEDVDIIKAKCELEHSDDGITGHFLFSQKPGQPTLLVGRVTGLAPGEHGFHIHQYGDLSNGCESAGPHFNPDGVDHGDSTEGHVGDLGNITADENGVAEINLILRRVDLSGDRSVVGRAIVVHADEDDLGQGGDEESLKTGNAGDRVGCGVIRMSE